MNWLDRLPRHFHGVMIANEVVDAMPVHAVAWRDEGIFERGVAIDDGKFAWAERPASGEVLAAASALQIAPPYASEIALAARGWISTIAESLERGALLVIDYGFPGREFYHPQRSTGTLMCHYRHFAHADPFLYPGLQDITAHVDFSALACCAKAAGLDLLGYANQSNFLVNCGITEVLERSDPADVKRFAPLAATAQKLLSPAEMGELFKVLCVGRGIAGPLAGFAHGERSHTL
jgi:SAM-dependent MidA family methyltransferase